MEERSFHSTIEANPGTGEYAAHNGGPIMSIQCCSMFAALRPDSLLPAGGYKACSDVLIHRSHAHAFILLKARPRL